LQYIVEQTLHGNAHDLTEQHIGNALFHKPSDYSPLEDSSVRVHVRQLRLKLHEYFNEDGATNRSFWKYPRVLTRRSSSGSESRDAFHASRAKGDSSPGIVLAGDTAWALCAFWPCCAEV